MIKIGGLQKLTLIDFPGRLAATIFLTGCNFRCPFCYSSELVLPEKNKKQPKISQKDFFKFLKEREKLIEGIVICGGEPVISQGLIPLIKKIKKMGFSVKLEAGTYRYEWIDPTKGKNAGNGSVRANGGAQQFKALFKGDAVLYLNKEKTSK